MNPFVGKTYGESLRLLAERYGAREALVFRGRRWSFSALKDEVDRASARLGALGLQPGEKVAIWMPNRPEFLFYWLGASQIGLVTVMLNTRLKREEVAYQLHQSDTVAVIVPGGGAFRDFLAELAALCPAMTAGAAEALRSAELPALRHVIAVDPPPPGYPGVHDWSVPAPATLPVPPLATDPEAVALIAYSSGTTALPKGAMLTHVVWRKAADHGDRFRQTADDRLYLCVPLFGILSTINGVLTFWSRGSAVVLDDHFDAETALRTLAAERCTAAYVLPVMIEQMLAHPDFDTFDLSALRTGIVLSVDPDVLRTAATRLGMRELFTSYGMTETSSAVTRTWWSDPLEIRVNTHGKPLPDIEVRVADPETGAPVPVGAVGEIQVKGYCVTPGYYKMPERTRQAFTADGWFKTGDAGKMLADGNLKFLHRLNDGYKYNGFNVSTTEVEAELLKHPDVEGAAVLGIPDKKHGEIGVAFVIPRAGATVAGDEIVAFLRLRIASYKLPRHVFTASEFPLTGGTGKVQKYRLREIALERLAGAAPGTAAE
jgi:acyl-CoA synthetase (AMP-forming)/AMP-acid ligase II